MYRGLLTVVTARDPGNIEGVAIAVQKVRDLRRSYPCIFFSEQKLRFYNICI